MIRRFSVSLRILQEILLIAAITLKSFEVLRGDCSIDAALTYVYDKGVYFLKLTNMVLGILTPTNQGMLLVCLLTYKKFMFYEKRMETA